MKENGKLQRRSIAICNPKDGLRGPFCVLSVSVSLGTGLATGTASGPPFVRLGLAGGWTARLMGNQTTAMVRKAKYEKHQEFGNGHRPGYGGGRLRRVCGQPLRTKHGRTYR